MMSKKARYSLLGAAKVIRFKSILPSSILSAWNRKECRRAGVHTPLVAGISGTKALGAFSICMSGGYEDDEDHDSTL